MPPEPTKKRTISFFDGQAVFHQAKEAFGYTFPNFDPLLLARAICSSKGWDLVQTRFYTGVPDKTDDFFWNYFWSAKLGTLGHKGIITISRPLRYRNAAIILKDGTTTTALVGQEKGIDVRIALDVIRLARENQYDVALIFSQDQDLAEAAIELKNLSILQNRWIKIASAYPDSPAARNRRGINNTEWTPIEKSIYDQCIDPADYRPAKKP